MRPLTVAAEFRSSWRRGSLEVRTYDRVGPPLSDQLWPIYATAFEPLRTQAAARHVLTRSEFDAELDDPRITVYVATDDDRPLGLATLTNDLDAVPWISPDYYRSRYPEEAARQAIYYIPFACTDTSRARPGVFWLLTQAFCAPAVETAGVLAYDICASNNASLDFARKMEVWYRRLGARHVEHVDSQHYYAAHYGGITNHGRTSDDPRDRRS